MAKELLIYGPLYSFSAELFINSLEDHKNDDVVLRINTNGGSPESTWGMIAKLSEHPKDRKIKVDGRADSMGLYFLCYSKDVQCLDVSSFTLHRASYGGINYEREYMSEPMKENLAEINKNLRKALEAKIDQDKLKAIKGVTLDQVFSMDTRIDVTLTAAEAKKIGLVDRIVKITPEIAAEIESMSLDVAAQTSGLPLKPVVESSISKPTNTMDKEQLKREHPAVYAAIVAEGVAQEKDRVGSWMAFNDVDPEAVKKGIESGTDISKTAMAELMLKSVSATSLKNVEADGQTPPVTTTEVDGKKDAEKEVEAFQAEVEADLGLKK